jgi:bifunctional pyridoxal-dependent enzyme with beta-cystathionase and maltose regulon repressor activities
MKNKTEIWPDITVFWVKNWDFNFWTEIEKKTETQFEKSLVGSPVRKECYKAGCTYALNKWGYNTWFYSIKETISFTNKISFSIFAYLKFRTALRQRK